MKNKNFLKVAIRNNAVYVPDINGSASENLNKSTFELIENLKKLGFSFTEKLLWKINNADLNYQRKIYDVFQEILGTKLNWTPMVKNWKIPTGETKSDHWITFFANIFNDKKGKTLDCGHLIPENTFPLERYNGCPFCGTPFRFGGIESFGTGSKMKVLELWTDKDIEKYFHSLLNSKTALDASQTDSFKNLIAEFNLPAIEIKMKETVMIAVDALIENEKEDEAGELLKTPNDILRYLWYKKTGFLQLIEPKTIIKRNSKNNRHFFIPMDKSGEVKIETKKTLKLKYSRKESLMVAKWLNEMELNSETICENMHPKRNMWIRFIRALRLAEFGKRKGFENLAKILDNFYNKNYTVLQGRIEYFRLKANAEETFVLLKKRPGLFARSLFSNILWFGEDLTLKHFEEIVDKIPMRLVLTLNMYAEIYFDKVTKRNVKTLGGTNKTIPANRWILSYEDDHLREIRMKIEVMSLRAIEKRFAGMKTENKTIYISPELYNIPLSIGDRSDNIQDLPNALMGTKFPLEGNDIRLFMQWGKGLPAQHLDMDLSCHIAYESSSEVCSYFNLTTKGCEHSGDIINIPNKIGTAEYVNLNLFELQNAGAKYVTFTCNAYSNGSISPNLIVGWMDSKFPMKISENYGVAYDPSCVMHQIRITNGLSKGLVFGVLDVDNREIIWLEMTYSGQNIQTLDTIGVQTLMKKLDSKMKIGDLLKIKAQSQNLKVVQKEDNADESYDLNWAINSANVTQLLLD
ncbi:hypothetical protein ASG01_10905 [Chryseobacterium sp. Leaf180]|uniref:hypothetical protein n=1 Tax=Chryseobacterium sp. Leaf180 TaxID=1736289 RepID=UPI0006F1D31E|nr:hypothetical protein [Chryseobacterium sp. Leaf180]KQR92427.1 hypothetical protein ASG01_10905 [Chryseobacterium sp. Leaf180]